MCLLMMEGGLSIPCPGSHRGGNPHWCPQAPHCRGGGGMSQGCGDQDGSQTAPFALVWSLLCCPQHPCMSRLGAASGLVERESVSPAYLFLARLPIDPLDSGSGITWCCWRTRVWSRGEMSHLGRLLLLTWGMGNARVPFFCG